MPFEKHYHTLDQKSSWGTSGLWELSRVPDGHELIVTQNDTPKPRLLKRNVDYYWLYSNRIVLDPVPSNGTVCTCHYTYNATPTSNYVYLWVLYGDFASHVNNKVRRARLNGTTGAFIEWSSPAIGYAFGATEDPICLRAHPTDPSVCYVATRANVYRCDGATLTRLYTVSGAGGNIIINHLYVEANGAVWFVVGAYPGLISGTVSETDAMGVYYAADGLTFTRKGRGIDGAYTSASNNNHGVQDIAVREPTLASPTRTVWTVHAAQDDPTDPLEPRNGISFSVDGGTEWFDLTRTLLNRFSSVDFGCISNYPRGNNDLSVFTYTQSAIDVRMDDLIFGSPFLDYGGIGNGPAVGFALPTDTTIRFLFNTDDGFYYRSGNSGASWSTFTKDTNDAAVAYRGYTTHHMKGWIALVTPANAKLHLSVDQGLTWAGQSFDLPNFGKCLDFVASFVG